jgi:hypothetical protein
LAWFWRDKVCGLPKMVESVEELLKKLGADPEKIVTEES